MAVLRTMLLPLTLFFLGASAAERLQNTTIDDTSAQITYSHLAEEAKMWKNGPQECGGGGRCAAEGLDISQLTNGTWSEVRSDNTTKLEVFAELSFTGVAVYVECVLAKPSIGATNMVFTLDNQVQPPFKPSISSDGDYEYHTIVFSKANISDVNQDHRLRVRAEHRDNEHSVIILDSMIYSQIVDDNGQVVVPSFSATSATPMPSTSSTSAQPSLSAPITNASMVAPSPLSSATQVSSTPKIVGGVLGALGGLILVALGLLVYRRRRSGRPLLPFFNTNSQQGEGGANLKRNYTFNPNLLVRARELAKKASTPSLRKRPAPLQEELLQSTSMRQVPDSAALYTASDRLLSKVQSWRQNTQRETATSPIPVAPLDSSEVLSSHYDDGTDIGPSPASLPPRPTQPAVKVWAVMNK